MLNLKKLLTKIVALLGVEYIQMRNYNITTPYNITPRPYKRLAVIIPDFYSVNSFRYKTIVRHIAANATSLTVPHVVIDGGTYSTDSAIAIDANLLMFREL